MFYSKDHSLTTNQTSSRDVYKSLQGFIPITTQISSFIGHGTINVAPLNQQSHIIKITSSPQMNLITSQQSRSDLSGVSFKHPTMTSSGFNYIPEESCDSIYSACDQEDDDDEDDDDDINKGGDTSTDSTGTPYLNTYTHNESIPQYPLLGTKIIKDQSIGNTAVKELKELIESVKSSGKLDESNPKNETVSALNSEMDIDFIPTEDCFTEEVPRLEMVEEPEEVSTGYHNNR